MKVGGVRRVVIPAEQGYGMVGRPPNVPERSPLVFEVRLTKVTDG
jgi:FKBP-type peptidyl-prolyl cis-trans isomerase